MDTNEFNKRISALKGRASLAVLAGLSRTYVQLLEQISAEGSSLRVAEERADYGGEHEEIRVERAGSRVEEAG